MVRLTLQEIEANTNIEKIAAQISITTNELRKAVGAFHNAFGPIDGMPFGFDLAGNADSDVFTSNIVPKLNNSVLRFLLIPNFSTGTPILSIKIIHKGKNKTGTILSGVTLTSGKLEVFDIPVTAKCEYNLVSDVDIQFDVMQVQELSP